MWDTAAEEFACMVMAFITFFLEAKKPNLGPDNDLKGACRMTYPRTWYTVLVKDAWKATQEQ